MFTSAIPNKIPKHKVDQPIISKLRIILKSYKCTKKPIKTIGKVLIIRFLKVISPSLFCLKKIVSRAIFEISFFK